ncbi:type II toxin-antitoxin system RelE/ParE family toxin [Thermococci archaeon]|nr:MAG: type II toxin-antitoxin system RelE/ParE family toxin [Thermococci archaeon]
MEIRVHPRVKKYLDKSDEKERLKEHLKELMNDPYTSRSGVDIKKLRGKKHDIYRLRVGDHRFEYFIEEGIVWIERAFKRGKEYQ